MKIDGKLIASEIKSELKEKVFSLKKKNIIPQLAVILIGNDPSSEAYVRQKLKVGEEIGVEVSIYRFAISESDKDTSGRSFSASTLGQTTVKTPQGWQAESHDSPGVEDYSKESNNRLKNKLINLVNKLNSDPLVHGIIIQRPVPIYISKEELDNLVISLKDVDGFHPNSPFTPPIASAVIKILEWVFQDIHNYHTTVCGSYAEKENKFSKWLRKQKILVIGRGETAGKPIAETLQKMGISITIAHSKTNNLKELCLDSDIIISCVGKRPILRHPSGSPQNGSFIVRHNMISNKKILIGVGLHQENGKLFTDYDQEEIADKVAYWTPVPGGVGPVNVACLFENLLAATSQIKL